MLILGMILIGISLGCLMGMLVDEDFYSLKKLIIFILLLIFGISAMVYDFTSPVKIISENTIYTNDYDEYDLNVDNKKLGIVKEIKKRAVYPLAIGVNGTYYYFIDFIEENK